MLIICQFLFNTATRSDIFATNDLYYVAEEDDII